MPDSLALFRCFIRVAEAGSFSAVAAELRTSQPTISRQVQALEAHLGTRLFHRTTRALSLTEDGRLFLGEARRALDTVAEAEAAVGRRRAEPSGTLRLGVAEVLGRLHLLPRMGRFLDAHPRVGLDLVLSDGFSDMVAEGLDLAVRVGALTDPGLVARRIGTTRRVVVATPGYLAAHGWPETPQALRAHRCIAYARLAAGPAWMLHGPDGQVEVPLGAALRVNSTEAVRAAVLEGLGIGMVPHWHFADGELASGRVVRLLEGWEPPPQPIHAVFPTRRFLPARVRAMVEFLAAEFAAEPLLN
ncbi:LysR family transcriptional regulator [Roseococcus sp. DSY-14]|uniref:LysR family transcriptional regulator n=1 Tax=Roseococcus sp. DSY-14 TaxID=3369650 RepID=UPI00387B104A